MLNINIYCIYFSVHLKNANFIEYYLIAQFIAEVQQR